MDPTPPDAYAGAQLRDGEVSTGTTIMAVSYAGGVVMGADSRVSTGTYIANRVSDKVSALHDKIFMCRSGSAADTQAVSDYVRHYLASHAIEVGAPPLVKTAASLAKRICYTNKEQLLAGVIVAGYDEVDGGSVYVIPLGGTCLKAPFAIGGSGSTYIYGHVDHEFKPGMSLSECKAFVAEAIKRAMARDGSSGGIVRLVCKNKKYTPICRKKKSNVKPNYQIMDYKGQLGGSKKKKKITRKTKKKSKNKKKKKTKRKNRHHCILYYFTMDGCPYCSDFNPHWEKVIKEFPNISMKKIERSEKPQLIKKFNVQSYPTIALSKGRKYVEFDGDRSDINMFHSFFKKNGIKTV